MGEVIQEGRLKFWIIIGLIITLLLTAAVVLWPDRSSKGNTDKLQLLSAEMAGDRWIKLTFNGSVQVFDADDFRIAASTQAWDVLNNEQEQAISVKHYEVAQDALNRTSVLLQLDTKLNSDGTWMREEYKGMLPMLTAAKYYNYDMNTNMVIADRLLTWQIDGGGWDKHIHERPDPKDGRKVIIDRAWDAQEPRSLLVDQSGNEAGTLENGATVNEMILLAKVYRETGDRRYKEALVKAIDYLLEMQYANGGWPLVFPLLGNEADAITFNGDAMARAMKVLSMVEQADYPFDYKLLDSERQRKVKAALDQGLDFIVHSQLQLDGRLTGWAKYYDPATGMPIHADDQLESAVSIEASIEIVKCLMAVRQPSDGMIAAIDGAIQYLKDVRANELNPLAEKLIHVYETTGYYEDQVYVEVTNTNSHNSAGHTLEKGSVVKVTASSASQDIPEQAGSQRLEAVLENRYAEQVEDKIVTLADITADTILVVAQDGSGDYVDVQAAIDAVPANNTKPVTIYIKEGLYHQKLVIPKDKPFITIIGESKFRTILTYLDITGTGFNGNSTLIEANDFTARNITFANEAGAIGTAAAVEVRGDRGYFEGVRLLGYQDTLYLNSKEGGRFYFRDCYIEGAVDFIYGPATAFLENCVIFNKRSEGYITAASTPKEQKYGIIFLNCTITGYPWVKNVYFGRPWRDYANDVFLHSSIDEGLINLQGWHNWGSLDKEKTARYREYGSYGPGATIRFRAKWTKQLSSDEAMEYTSANVLSGNDGWAPYH